jgi:hypothetical protein
MVFAPVSVQIILDTYNHITPELWQAVANHFNEIIMVKGIEIDEDT